MCKQYIVLASTTWGRSHGKRLCADQARILSDEMRLRHRLFASSIRRPAGTARAAHLHRMRQLAQRRQITGGRQLFPSRRLPFFF